MTDENIEPQSVYGATKKLNLYYDPYTDLVIITKGKIKIKLHFWELHEFINLCFKERNKIVLKKLENN